MKPEVAVDCDDIEPTSVAAVLEEKSYDDELLDEMLDKLPPRSV